MKVDNSDIRPGSLVRAGYNRGPRCLSLYTGIVTGIDEREAIFSEKYGITETETYVRVLCEEKIMTFVLEEDTVEVISAAR